MAKEKNNNSGRKIVCVNKKSRFNFHVDKKFEAGLVLKGSEVKSIRQGKIQLVDSYVAVELGEAYLYKAHISEYKQGGPFFNHEPARKRKLLLRKKEIQEIKFATEAKGATVIPVSVYLTKGLIKAEIGLAKGKSQADKRATLKDRDEKKRLQQELKRKRT